MHRVASWLVAGSLVGLAACSEDPKPEPGNAETGRPSASDLVEVVDLDGLKDALGEVRGTPHLLNFWALWCAPCVAELPDLAAVAVEYEGRAKVLTVNYDFMMPLDSEQAVLDRIADFLEEHGYDWPVYVYDEDGYGPVNEYLDLPGGVPVTLAFNAAGEMVAMHEDIATREEFRALMEKALD